MQYRDFNIRILSKSDDGYFVQVDSPAGHEKALIKLDIENVEHRISQIGGNVRGSSTREAEFDIPETQTPVEVGARLYNALFTDGIRTMYDRSCGEVLSDPNMGLRIKLHVDIEDPELAAVAQLPWEFAYESGVQEYLALSRQTPIVRYIDVAKRLTTYSRQGKLRILVVIASPRDHAQLDLAKERKLIEDSWAGDDSVEVDFLEHPTRTSMQQALEESPCHVLHFMGHGAYDAVSRSGALVIEDSDGNADMLDAQTIKVWLRDVPSLRLIFLNACNTGKADENEPFAGVANSLVLAGLPAVLAMQFPISDTAAIDFARVFYSRLVKGSPVDEATTQGRKAVFSGNSGAMEWATPVLYMRAPNGQLFDETTDEAPAGPEKPVAPVVSQTPISAEETPENTIKTLSIFIGVLFAGVAGFSAYRRTFFQDPIFVSFAAVILMIIGVGSCVAVCYHQYRHTNSPRYNALLALSIFNIGILSGCIAGPVVHVAFGVMKWSDYNVTVFIGLLGTAIFATLLFYQRRGAAWVYTVAPPFAVFLILGHSVSLGRQFVMASGEGTWWTSSEFAYLHLLITAVSFSAIIVSSTYLLAHRRFKSQ